MYEGCAPAPGCSAVDCEEIVMMDECAAIAHCEWSADRCRRKLASICSGLGESDCNSEKSCRWGLVCDGSPPPCLGRDSEEECRAAGCYWERRRELH